MREALYWHLGFICAVVTAVSTALASVVRQKYGFASCRRLRLYTRLNGA